MADIDLEEREITTELNGQTHQTESSRTKEAELRRLRAHRRENEKAFKVLGHDPSKEKAKERLGLDDEDLRQATAALSQIDDDTIHFSTNGMRRSEPMIDKKANKKALDVLGVDPSTEKIINKLGLANAEEALQALEQSHNAVDNSDINGVTDIPDASVPADKKTNRKALERLGYNPSQEKLNDKLGFNDPVFTIEEVIANKIISLM